MVYTSISSMVLRSNNFKSKIVENISNKQTPITLDRSYVFQRNSKKAISRILCKIIWLKFEANILGIAHFVFFQSFRNKPELSMKKFFQWIRLLAANSILLGCHNFLKHFLEKFGKLEWSKIILKQNILAYREHSKLVNHTFEVLKTFGKKIKVRCALNIFHTKK